MILSAFFTNLRQFVASQRANKKACFVKSKPDGRSVYEPSG